MTEPPQKWGLCRLKIDRGIVDEARMHKYTHQACMYHKWSESSVLQLMFIDYNKE
jgi:hypothetical protein